MKTLIAITLLSATLVVSAAPTAAAETAVRGSVSSRFTGSSTLHDFTGVVPPSALTVEPEPDGSWSATVDIPVAALSTENASRDRKMREMFHAEEYPTLRAEFAHVVPDDVRASGQLPFRLTISGARRDIVSTVRDWRQTGDSVAFIAEFDISLSSFGLEAPRAFVIVVADTVHVTTEVSLRRE